MPDPKGNCRMDKIHQLGPHSRPERRQHRRFDLQYPVRLRFQLADVPGTINAISKNVAVGGLLLKTAVPIPQHTRVGFVMSIEGGRVPRPIHLVGDGEVIRLEPEPSGAGFAIAVECTQSISELESSILGSPR